MYADLKQQQAQFNKRLTDYLPTAKAQPQRLHQAMRYACLNGGKRIRPLLIYAVGELLGAEIDDLHGPACAVEMIHCYSLIHDDLPAMDDDDLRRGQPTCHKAFDEATAILAGDALQALAFEVLATYPATISYQQRLAMIAQLAKACGAQGMAGGQAMDLAATDQATELDYVKTMHQRKTGALINASLQMAAIATNSDTETLTIITNIGESLGLAFQIQDDILDITADTEQLGKPQGADLSLNKSTYPALVGLENAQQQVMQLAKSINQTINTIPGHSQALRQLINYILITTQNANFSL